MQTFVSDPKSYYHSLKTLDPSRLGNQIYREGKTLINGGWQNHPAYKMWKDCRIGLAQYCIEGLKILRDERNRNYPKHFDFYNQIITEEFNNAIISSQDGIEYPDMSDFIYPDWWGNEDVHASHRAVLLTKGLMDETFNRFKCSQKLYEYPLKKSDWNWEIYQKYWKQFGMPDIKDTWYGQFNWTEKPAEPIKVGKKYKMPYVWPI